MIEISKIFDFVEKNGHIKKESLSPETDIFEASSIDGDDCSEMMEKFAKDFSVDMSNYLWYFHHGEEVSFNPGAIIFLPPDRRVKRIPITPITLLESVNLGEWAISYRPHTLPKRRYDIYLSWVFGIVMLVALSLVLLFKK